MHRLTFLSHFVICLAVAAIAFFAGVNGVFHTVYQSDASMMTSVIAVGLIGSMIYIGWQAWLVDERAIPDNPGGWLRARNVSADFGHLAERALPMLGLFGTAFGLSLQAKALTAGSAAFGPLATSLYCTASGVLAALIVAILTFNLERGIRRA